MRLQRLWDCEKRKLSESVIESFTGGIATQITLKVTFGFFVHIAFGNSMAGRCDLSKRGDFNRLAASMVSYGTFGTTPLNLKIFSVKDLIWNFCVEIFTQ